MNIRSLVMPACLLVAPLLPVFTTATAHADPIVVTLGSSFANAPISFSIFGSTFTLSSTGDFFFPTAIQTSGDAAVTAFGGFLGFPVTPTTDFPNRGSGILTYGPGTQFASFDTTTTIPYSNGDNYLGLRVTVGGLDYYGYAFTTDTTLNSFGFETTPGTAFTIDTNATGVPEAATWAMMLIGFGAIGATLRRRQRVSSVRFA